MTRHGLLPPGAAQELRDARYRQAAWRMRIPWSLTALRPSTPTIPAMRSRPGCSQSRCAQPGRELDLQAHAGQRRQAGMTSAAGRPAGSRRAAVRRRGSRRGRAGDPGTGADHTAWQSGTAGWRLGEARRLRDLAGRATGPDGPAAAPAPDRTITDETALRSGDRGQAGGA